MTRPDPLIFSVLVTRPDPTRGWTRPVVNSAGISPELHVRSSSSYLRMLAMSVARSSYGGVAIRFVHPAAGSDIYNCFVHFVYLAYPLFARGSENWCVVFLETLIQRQC